MTKKPKVIKRYPTQRHRSHRQHLGSDKKVGQCGRHTHHIPICREMASLRAVQMNDRAAERIMDITAGRRVVIVAPVEEPLGVG
jgi:hypothetical protein